MSRMFGFDADDEFYEEDLQHQEDFDQDMVLPLKSLEHFKQEVKNSILSMAINICQQSWWWRWKSTKKKLSEISHVYFKLRQLTQDD